MKTWWGKRSFRAKVTLGVSAGAVVGAGVCFLVWWLVSISKGITPWQIATEFAIPLFVGAAGTAVAVAAFTTSRRATDISERAMHAEDERTDRAARVEAATHINEWLEIALDGYVRRLTIAVEPYEKGLAKALRDLPFVPNGPDIAPLVAAVSVWVKAVIDERSRIRHTHKTGMGWRSPEHEAVWTDLAVAPMREIGLLKKTVIAWARDPGAAKGVVKEAVEHVQSLNVGEAI